MWGQKSVLACQQHPLPISSSRRSTARHQQCRQRARLTCRAQEGITDTIKIKQRQISSYLKELGSATVEERINDSLATPLQPSFQLVSRICSVKEIQARPAVILELARTSPAMTRDELVELARSFDGMGADLLAFKASSWRTWEETMGDLFALARAVKLPLLLRDILIHPIQIADAKMAGAAGILGVITAVTGRSTPVMSSYACSLGLDCPVEVVNLAELEPMIKAGAAVFGINISVGLATGIAGARMQTAAGILRTLPHDCMGVVGIQALEEGKQAAEAGAHAVLLKAKLLRDQAAQQHDADEVVRELMYQLSGDD